MCHIFSFLMYKNSLKNTKNEPKNPNTKFSIDWYVALSLSHIFFKKWNFDFFCRKNIFFCWFFTLKTPFHGILYISSVCAKFGAKNYNIPYFWEIFRFFIKNVKKIRQNSNSFPEKFSIVTIFFSDFSRYLWCVNLQGKIWSYII